MDLKTVAILSPGDMGHAVGRTLGEHGIRVISCLKGRSERTRILAERGNIQEVPTLEEMVAQADLVLSILVPSEAVAVAHEVADALRTNGASTPFADCNAISPQTTLRMRDVITEASGTYIDGSIIGGPPGGGPPPRFYVSWPHAAIMTELDGKGIAVRAIGDAIGRASGIKMCYAALTKGTSALHATAEALGLSAELREELEYSQGATYERMRASIPGLPAKAFRWIGEMEEIAATFEHIGVTPGFHEGAAEVFRLLSETPFARETPETIDSERTLEQTIAAAVELLPATSAER